LGAKDMAIGVSDKYYHGLLSAYIVNYSVGAIEVVIIPNLLDPLGLYLVETAKLTFFPATTLLFACLILIVFKSDDTLTLDAKRNV
jgi:putative oxidoreductase